MQALALQGGRLVYQDGLWLFWFADVDGERDDDCDYFFVARLHHRGFLQELLQESERAVECSTALSDGASST